METKDVIYELRTKKGLTQVLGAARRCIRITRAFNQGKKCP